nr:MAG TPA: hypothetical protein [Bacteriophage sp.]
MTCYASCVLVSKDHLVGDRVSTTNASWRNYFPFGIVFRSLNPIFDLFSFLRCEDLKFRHKKTAMLSGAETACVC